jgi:DNA gyrase inhibitor GyrI
VCAGQAWSILRDALASLPEELREQALFVGRALDDPHADGGPAPNAVRFAAGVAGLEHDLRLEPATTHAGVYARFRYTGKLASLGLAYHHIYGQWRESAAESGYALSNEPALLLLDSLPIDSEQFVTIAVPLVPDVHD